MIAKIPRGRIYHSLRQSFQYFFGAFWKPLDNKDKISKFEVKFAHYCDRGYCIAFPFARTAIYFILKSLNLPKGTEVLLPPITIKGILDVVVHLGLVPRYVDLDPETMSFDLDKLKCKIGTNSKVAIVTPLFGLVPNMDAIISILRNSGIFIIEDFSQCLNGRFKDKKIGTFGDVGVYSASSIKTLDTLGGGLVVTNDEKLNKILRLDQESLQSPKRIFLIKKAWLNLLRNFLTIQPFFSLLTYPAIQFIRIRNPEAALKQTGHRDKSPIFELPKIWFCSYTSLQADIGLNKLDSVETYDDERICNANYIKSNSFRERFPVTTKFSKNIYWQLILISPNSIQAQSFFANHGIDIATSSLELVCALPDYPNSEDLPIAKVIHRNGIFIPCYPGLSESELNRISTLCRKFFYK